MGGGREGGTPKGGKNMTITIVRVIIATSGVVNEGGIMNLVIG